MDYKQPRQLSATHQPVTPRMRTTMRAPSHAATRARHHTRAPPHARAATRAFSAPAVRAAVVLSDRS